MVVAIDLIKLPQILLNSFWFVCPFVACWREWLVFQVPPVTVWEMAEHLLLIHQHRGLCLTTTIVRKFNLTANMWVHLQDDCWVICTEFTGSCCRKMTNQPIQETSQIQNTLYRIVNNALYRFVKNTLYCIVKTHIIVLLTTHFNVLLKTHIIVLLTTHFIVLLKTHIIVLLTTYFTVLIKTHFIYC
jgi:hypothetical protein